MPSTYSSNLKIELMSTGENSGTWGNITNTNLGTALEQAIVGYGAVSYLSDANLTISITNTNAAQAARALVLNVTSALSLTATRELVVPTIEKQYIVQNNTTGSQSITVKTSAGTGITVPNGRKAHLYVDGTNVIQMFDFVDINGGTIDGTPIGGSSAAAGAFTSLTASGATTLNGAVALGDASGDLITVPGTINSNLLFTDNSFDIGASGANRPRNLFLAGAATVGGNLSVGGTLTLTGGLILNGNVTVGDSSADTLTVNATITSNLLFTDNTYDIGASGATRPRNLFLAGSATIGGNVTTAGRVIVDDTTDSTSATTGSIQTDGGLGVAKALFVGTTVTVNGGTANGVAYLNGSKVLTTGSALTFDGSANFSFTGSGLYPVISVAPTGNNAIFGFRMDASAGNGVDWRVEQGRSAVGDFNISAPGVNAAPQYAILKNLSAQYWSIGGSGEQMRLTSTGLLIKTASAINGWSYPLQVNGFVGIQASANNNLEIFTPNSGTGIRLFARNNAGTLNRLELQGGQVIFPLTTGADGLYFDASSGNLGIATSSPTQQLTVGGSGNVLIAAGGTLFSSGKLFIRSGAGQNMDFGANDVNSLMVLNTSGNVGIGTQSPTARLGIFAATGNTAGVHIQPSGWPYFNRIGPVGTAGNQFFISQNWNAEANTVDSASYGTTAIRMDTSGFTFLTGGTGLVPSARVTLTNTGEFGVGTASPSARIDAVASATALRGAVTEGSMIYRQFASSATSGITELHLRANNGKSTYITFTEDQIDDRWSIGTQNGNGSLRFIAGVPTIGTERMVLTNGGYLGIGASSPQARLHTYEVNNSTSTMSGVYVQNFSGTNNSQAGIGFWAYDNFNAKIYTFRSGSSAGNLVFATNGGGGTGESNVTERARITSGGAFIVGGTSAANSAVITASGAGTMGMSAYVGNNNGTINTIASSTGSGGGMIIISGVSFGSGQSFSRLYLAGVRVAGGATSVFTSAIASVGEAGVSFSFAESGGFITATASGLPSGTWTVMWINC